MSPSGIPPRAAALAELGHCTTEAKLQSALSQLFERGLVSIEEIGECTVVQLAGAGVGEPAPSMDELLAWIDAQWKAAGPETRGRLIQAVREWLGRHPSL